MESITGLPPGARFFLLLVPRIITGRCSATRLASHALALIENGNRRLGAWCWDKAIRRCLHDETAYESLLDFCVAAGHNNAAEALANSFYDANGLAPGAAVGLVGKLTLNYAFDSALRIYDRLARHCGDDVGGVSPAPAWGEQVSGRAVRVLLAARAACENEDGAGARDLYISLARLCFSFAAFDTSARLFERAGEHLAAEDRVAHAYAVLRSNQTKCSPQNIESLYASAQAVPGADWQILLASVLFARGAVDGAASAVEKALRAKLAGPEVEHVVADCRRIIAFLASCREALALRGDETGEPHANEERRAIRKLFICGNGWSGSGALYDAITEYDGLTETPDTPGDRYINECTSNEMMFVQGRGGLGWLWRIARQDHNVLRRDLWELFRCNILGGGAIGHSEHKTANAASNLLTNLGGRYTAIFRRTFESLAALPEGTPVHCLRSLLAETTESLTAVITGAGEDDCVVFNNAVFGPNVDMLDIFRNFRAAVVVRDPLDQYADRRAQDLKHWMSPNRFVPFYRRSREAFHTRRKQMRHDHAREVREVEFEHFVLDERYRQGVLDWLLEGREVRRARRRFEAERSARNIGIHTRLLSARERRVIEKELKRWRRN